ncbi:MAG TPA: S8 family serine peptidase [Burkholderiaceae bacterium]|nr:S8 family serine peptidase [Burkholderiaceae bacterium]
MKAIPQFVVEYFLLGKTRPDNVERLAQDGGIVTDVWVAFGMKPDVAHRLLLAPTQGTTAIELGACLHESLTEYRRQHKQSAAKEPPSVSPMEGYVAATIYLDELLRVVMPLTSWWHDMNLLELRAAASQDLVPRLREQVMYVLGHRKPERLRRSSPSRTVQDLARQRVIEAAPVAALIGLFTAARLDPKIIDAVAKLDPRKLDGDASAFERWVVDNAGAVTDAAIAEVSRLLEPAVVALSDQTTRKRTGVRMTAPAAPAFTLAPPVLIHRAFLNRRATLAVADGSRAIKADAANLLFRLSCKDVTWAIIDSGIDAGHSAFVDHAAPATAGVKPSRVRKTYDFTQIERIRSFDMTLDLDNSPGRTQYIAALVAQLDGAPGRVPSPSYRELARKNLEVIARQLDEQVVPDWSLIEPIIRIPADQAGHLSSDHGTHVAGILGADWREATAAANVVADEVMAGVCPDINLIDFRVIHDTSLDASEAAVLAALEFIKYLNDKAGLRKPVIHGANISLSIPHEVKNYGCGATPICVAADRLSDSGVVVVAAAGNRGWNEQESGFGTFVFCSITDPGNAHKVITVGSTHRDQPHTYGVSFFSSRGPTGDGRIKPDLLAPGEKILAPLPGDIDGRKNGTSMAAPFVSGAAAMLLARYPELAGDSARIKSILCETATDLGREHYFQGHGLVDVLRALQSV